MLRRRQTNAIGQAPAQALRGRCLRLERLEDRRLLAAVPQMLTDGSRPDGVDSNPHSFIQVGDVTYFVASGKLGYADTGEELWRTDGTSAGTQLVKDLLPGYQSSRPRHLTNVNGTLFFTADVFEAGVYGNLWKTDGTAAGTVRMTEAAGATLRNSYAMVEMNGVWYFAGEKPGEGTELWRTDGTAAGTWRVKDIRAGAQSSIATPGYREWPELFVVVGDTLYFRANDGVTGTELWKSDGTEAGTMLVKDIRTGEGGSVASWLEGRSYASIGDVIYFAASSGASGVELWRSDGTEAGTFLVSDVSSGASYVLADQFTAVEDAVFFVTTSGNRAELWTSDGTTAGTRLVLRNTFGSSSLYDLTAFNGTLYFSNNAFLWRTDGTAEGTAFVPRGGIPLSIYLARPNASTPAAAYDNLTVFDGKLFFAGNFSSPGSSTTLLEYDPATGIAQALVDGDYYMPLPENPANLTVAGGKLFFGADGRTSTRTGIEPWESDGTETGTRIIKDLTGQDWTSYTQGLLNVDGQFFFSAPREPVDYPGGSTPHWLWTLDLSTNKATPFVMLPRQSSGSVLRAVGHAGGLYFFSTIVNNSPELWRSDGTAEGTYRVRDLTIRETFGLPGGIELNGVLYFGADDGENGYELWRSDGTETGTWMVKDLNAGPGGLNSSAPLSLLAINGSLYFSVFGPSSGLWKSDGTADGTELVRSFTGAQPNYLTNVDGTLYFAASVAGMGNSLWKSDGTSSGTTPVRVFSTADEIPRALSYPNRNRFDALDGALFFVAGDALWKSDGTEEGTVLLKDIRPDGRAFGFDDIELFASGSAVYFLADDGVHGRELWRSDGTPEGTTLVKDLRANGSVSGIFTGADVSGTFYFTTNDGVNGQELWRTNGTDAGTVMALSRPGLASWNAGILFAIDGKLYFGGDDGIHGAELWVLGPDTELIARGDYDQDGDTDGADFLKWQRNVGSRDATVDGDGSGQIDGGDLQVWEENFGVPADAAAANAMLASGAAGVAADEQSADAALAEFDATTAAGLAGRWNNGGAVAQEGSRLLAIRGKTLPQGLGSATFRATDRLPFAAQAFRRDDAAIAIAAPDDVEGDAAWSTALDEFETLGAFSGDWPRS